MIHNWITIAAKENSLGIDKISPPMELLDHEGKLIYSSAGAGNNIFRISMINMDERLNFILKAVPNVENRIEAFFAFSEYASLTSPVDLIQNYAAPISVHAAKDDIIYISGYPGKTTVFGSIKKGDTPGDKLVSSSGRIIGLSDQQQLIASWALATSGMSGGMVNNSKGEIIGIACNGNKGDRVYDDMASTSIMLDTKAIKLFWQFMLNTPL